VPALDVLRRASEVKVFSLQYVGVNCLYAAGLLALANTVPVAWGFAVVEQQIIAPASGAPTTAYARFTRRIQGLMIDNMILIVGFIIAVFLATSTGFNGASRAIGLAAFAALLLYEPVLVSTKGGTIGHSLRNLRVVDDRTGGNIGFVAAFVRFVAKVVLGAFSFVAMITTKRHQTFHDLLTHSTVQVRDIQKAQPHHYVGERSELPVAGMPSKARRILAILVYSILLIVVWSLALGVALRLTSILSQACLRAGRCDLGEHLFQSGMGLSLFCLAGWVTFIGWNGRLFGSRVRA
jgi:RDD family